MLLTFHGTYVYAGEDSVLAIAEELPGVIAQGTTLEDARSRLAQLLTATVQDMTDWQRVKETVEDQPVLSRESITVDDEEPVEFCPNDGIPPLDNPDATPEEIAAWAEMWKPTSFELELMSPHDERTGELPDFTLPEHRRFIEDMHAIGLHVHLYDGKGEQGDFPYYGPAITTRDRVALQDVIRATTVRLRWHHMHELGAMVYPAANDAAVVRGRPEILPSN